MGGEEGEWTCGFGGAFRVGFGGGGGAQGGEAERAGERGGESGCEGAEGGRLGCARRNSFDDPQSEAVEVDERQEEEEKFLRRAGKSERQTAWKSRRAHGEGFPDKLAVQELEADVGSEGSLGVDEPHLQHAVNQGPIPVEELSAESQEQMDAGSPSIVQKHQEVDQSQDCRKPLPDVQQLPTCPLPLPLPLDHLLLSSPAPRHQPPQVDEREPAPWERFIRPRRREHAVLQAGMEVGREDDEERVSEFLKPRQVRVGCGRLYCVAWVSARLQKSEEAALTAFGVPPLVAIPEVLEGGAVGRAALPQRQLEHRQSQQRHEFWLPRPSSRWLLGEQNPTSR